jgi:quercetin dioxygenase-like cupin family protein
MPLPWLPPRNLDRSELQRLVEALAREPASWCEPVPPTDASRHFFSLYRDDYVDVWVITWTARGDTGWHDHDISSGAVHVIEGALRESNPRLGGEDVERVFRAGQSFTFGPDHIHRMSGDAEHSVSIHAYSPPLWRMGQYSFDAEGVMRRVSLSYADELRPLVETPAAA